MKCMLLSYFLALLVIWNISNVQTVKLKNEKHQSDEIKKLIDCKICQEMFQYEFNYEKLLKDDSKINFIKSFFADISETDFNLREYFSKDNLDFVSKEISMQYFFKGEESLFASEEHLDKFKNCKNLKTADATENANSDFGNFSNKNSQCDVMKLKICESVLSLEADSCVGFQTKIKLFASKRKQGNLNKDRAGFSGDNAGSELEVKKKFDKESSSGNAVFKNFNKANEQVKNVNSNENLDKNILNSEVNYEKKGKDSNAAGDDLSSSFITKENTIENYELLDKKNIPGIKVKTNNSDENNYSGVNIEESFKKFMEIKAKKDQDENKIKDLNNLNFRSFNGIEQNAMNEDNEAFAAKDFNKLIMQSNILKNENRNENNAKSKEGMYKEMLLKMLNKESNAAKGSESDVFPGKRLNFPVKPNKTNFDTQGNLGNDFSKKKNIMINKNSFMQRSRETPSETDENSKMMNFLQKMMGNAPSNLNSNNSSLNKNPNPSLKDSKKSPQNYDLNAIEKLGQTSYLELSPEYIQKNFDSNPKTHWQPPKPVLLENFENNIGSQLKEISSLASDIAKTENKLKAMKQQLANKLETFQSTYNVVQKTISEISKLVSLPNFPSYVKSPTSFTEDDWDESAKPKFLNK